MIVMKSPIQRFKRRKLPTGPAVVDNSTAGGSTHDNFGMSSQELSLPSELLWLLDAPLFIDTKQVDAFYDAVLRPDYEGTSITLSNSITKETSFGGQTTVGVALPWFGKAEVAANVEKNLSHDQGHDTTLKPISNAYRHLLAIALHYASQRVNGRLVIADTNGSRAVNALGKSILHEWLESNFVESVPRALIFLDMPPGTKLIPSALELTNGKIDVVLDTLGKELGGSNFPTYPSSTAPQGEKDSYFKWFTEHYINYAALRIIEAAAQEQKISWIDFNVSLKDGEPPFMHLHLVGHGDYDTGVFGYYFTLRGFTHGLRIVGTLKSGPDLNVLAVFER
jgi:hypothetical protein